VPSRDASKIQCFKLWTDGATLKKIQSQVTAAPTTVRDWVREWERGKAQSWDAQAK
jgi:transposase-like protein